MAVGHKGQRAENAACSGALSSSTITVTITAKTASEYAASRCAVSFSSCLACFGNVSLVQPRPFPAALSSLSESGDAIQLAVSDFLPEPREMDNVK